MDISYSTISQAANKHGLGVPNLLANFEDLMSFRMGPPAPLDWCPSNALSQRWFITPRRL
jgi:hypothetical protein